MRDEYLNLIPSLEYNLTCLLAEYLDVQIYLEEFNSWFTRVPTPFGAKPNLFEVFTRESSMLSQLADANAEFRASCDFRNTLAHSFPRSDRTASRCLKSCCLS